MSRSRKRLESEAATQARVFAALGDETRLAIVRKLAGGEPHSIAELTVDVTEGRTKITRQGVTKHLRVLEAAGLVHSIRSGRENLFEINPLPINDLREYLELVSAQADEKLLTLKSFVEK